LRKGANYRYPNLPPDLSLASYKENAILSAFVQNRKRKWITPIERSKKPVNLRFTLKNFSFVDKPVETMEQLRRIAEAECTSFIGQLDFEDEVVLDIGPYVVLAWMWRDMCPFLRNGSMGIPVKKVIEAVHLRKFLRMAKFKMAIERKDVWAFPLMERTPGHHDATLQKSVAFSIAADKLVETINEWLSKLPVPMHLSREAEARVNKIATEILDNAERHGGIGDERGNWQIAGCMAREKTSGKPYSYDCHVAIVNLGTVISSNMFDNLKEEWRRKDLDKYIGKHRRKVL